MRTFIYPESKDGIEVETFDDFLDVPTEHLVFRDEQGAEVVVNLRGRLRELRDKCDAAISEQEKRNPALFVARDAA